MQETYRGVILEAEAVAGTVYLTIDGVESKKTFPSRAHALDYGHRRLNAKAKADARAAAAPRESGGEAFWQEWNANFMRRMTEA